MDTGRSHICGLEGKQREYRSWSDLPSDILNIITGHSGIIEQIRIRAVCKNWRMALIQFENRLPWLVGHRWEYADNGAVLSSCKFHIPSYTQTQTNIIEDEEQYNFFGAGICASKYGWLLLQKSRKPFFYNPFSRNVIELPDMDISFNRATFSSVPTSRDCVCFAIQSAKVSDKISISTCSPGDLKWRTRVLDGFYKAAEDVVYSNGYFYCVFTGGVLGAFCVVDWSWRLLTNMEPVQGIRFYCRAQMVESNGELLLICRSQRFYIFGFDSAALVWVRKNRLGNQALFLGCTSFSVSAEEETSILADRIYYHGNTRTCFYSLKTDKSCFCDEFYPWFVEYSRERIWIEPPQF